MTDAKLRAAYGTYVEMCSERALKPVPFEEHWFGEYNRFLGARPYIKTRQQQDAR